MPVLGLHRYAPQLVTIPSFEVDADPSALQALALAGTHSPPEHA